MKYLSIDIETTGIDSENCEILSIGAILEDTENILPFEEAPKFHCAINRRTIKGEMFATNMNRDLIQKIVHYQSAKDQDEKNDIVHMTGMNFLPEEDIVQEFYWWLYANGAFKFDVEKMLDQPRFEHPLYGKVPHLTSKMQKAIITVAGKNFASFDKIFLEKLPRWKQAIYVRSRIIDPAIFFTDWKEDSAPPSLGDCKKRAGIEGIVTHDALEDAWDVILLLRKIYNKDVQNS
jgi:oligoribonuclease